MKPRQSEAEYQEIKKILSASNVSCADDMQDKMNGMMKAAKLYSIAGASLVVTLLILLPKFSVFTVLLYCLYMAWLWSSTLSSKHYFKRYLDESTSQEKDG